MTKIYLTEEQQSLLHNLGTTLDGRYFFIPHWLEKTDDGAFVVHPLENLPEKLSMRIQQERERSGVAYFTRLPTHLGIGDIITIEEAQTHEGGIWTDHKAEEYRILDKGLRCLMVSPKELGGRIKLTQRDLDSGCYKIRKP